VAAIALGRATHALEHPVRELKVERAGA
jgi:hypothetical protein